MARGAGVLHIHAGSACGAAFGVVAAFERTPSYRRCLSSILLLVSKFLMLVSSACTQHPSFTVLAVAISVSCLFLTWEFD